MEFFFEIHKWFFLSGRLPMQIRVIERKNYITSPCLTFKSNLKVWKIIDS